MSNYLASSAISVSTPFRLWRSASPPKLSQWQSLTRQRVHAPHYEWFLSVLSAKCQVVGHVTCCSLEFMLQQSLCQLYKLCKFIHELIMSDVSDPKVWLKLAIDLINHDLIAWHWLTIQVSKHRSCGRLRKGASITVSLLRFSSLCLFIDPLLRLKWETCFKARRNWQFKTQNWRTGGF